MEKDAVIALEALEDDSVVRKLKATHTHSLTVTLPGKDPVVVAVGSYEDLAAISEEEAIVWAKAYFVAPDLMGF